MADLDRLISLTVRGAPTRTPEGRVEPGPVIFTGKVWARQTDASAELDRDGGVIRYAGERAYRIRWRDDVALGILDRYDVTDDLGIPYRVAQVSPSRERREYLDLSLTRRT